MRDKIKSSDKITSKDDDPIQSLQSKDDVVKREYQDNLKQNLDQIDTEFQSRPKSPRWRRWEHSRKIREFLGPTHLSEKAQLYDVAKNMRKNARSLQTMLLDSEHAAASTLTIYQHIEITGLISLFKDNYTNLAINRQIDQRIQQWEEHLNGKDALPPLDKTLAQLLDNKKKQVEATSHPDTSTKHPEKHVLNVESLRVSCASFVRVQDSQGRYLVLINKSSKEKDGKLVFTPIGGALEMTDAGKLYIMSQLGVKKEHFEKKKEDLRFTMHGKEANTLQKWFLQRDDKQRETSPLREFQEELGPEETGLFSEGELPNVRTQHVGYHREIALTSRAGHEGALTLRLLEVHDFQESQGSKELIKKLIQIESENKKRDDPLRFVTADEIEAGQTSDGIDIGSVTKALLRPQETLEELH